MVELFASQVDFEAAAQSILMETLQEARRIRPQVLWGVASYPSCYNSGPDRRSGNYTGRCPASEMALNDELLWLWKRSSAIFPTLRLDKLLGRTQAARLYASSQIREALRVATLSGAAYSLPVFPLVKSVYTSTNTFLSEVSLLHKYVFGIQIIFYTFVWCIRSYEIVSKSANLTPWSSWLAQCHQARLTEDRKVFDSI